MVKTTVELERASIVEGVIILKVGKFGGDSGGSFLPCLAIEDDHFIALGY
jgi:hypothetical protein